MDNLIPINQYSLVYYNILLIFVLFYCFQSWTGILHDRQSLMTSSAMGWILSIFLILVLGLRPLSWIFGDMNTYADFFAALKISDKAYFQEDIGFDLYINLLADVVSVETFFLVTFLIYLFPLYVISKRYFSQYWMYAFLLFIASFSFYTYGTNGIRNGLATSIFLLGLAYMDKKWLCWGLLALSITFHKSMLLPVAAYLLTLFFKNPKWYFYGWLICIPLSLAAGGFWESVFSGLLDDRRSSYLTQGNINNDNFASTGFRWDFLIYSALPVVLAFFYIFKKNYYDTTYNRIVGVYLTANGFWILVIRANFSNRFAYLSWFIMALVVIYPLLKVELVNRQQQQIGTIIFLYFMMTYAMNIIFV